MKYKLTKKIDIENSEVNDLINSEYFTNYIEGVKVIVDDKIAVIHSTSLTHLTVNINGKTLNVNVNPDNPEEDVLLLRDVLLEEEDNQVVSYKKSKVKIIGRYINNKNESKLVIQSLDNSYTTIVNSLDVKEYNIEKISASDSKAVDNKSIGLKSSSDSDSLNLQSDNIKDTDRYVKDDIDIKSVVEYPVDRESLGEKLHENRLPIFCKFLSKMKPLSQQIIKERRTIIYKLIIKKFNITQDMLQPTNIDKLLEKISNNEFIKILIRSYDISFFGRKYRRYTGITGCKAKICINDNCFETEGYEDYSEESNTIISINFNTEKIKKIIKLLENDNIKLGFFGEQFNDAIKCIQIIFEHEFIHSLIDCLCLSLKKSSNSELGQKHSHLFKKITFNLFGHDTFTNNLLIKK